MEDNVLKLKAISDVTRYKTIKLLLSKKYCVRAISRKLKITEAAVSQHLQILRKAGIVTGEKEGYFTHYRVNKNILTEIAATISELAKGDNNIKN